MFVSLFVFLNGFLLDKENPSPYTLVSRLFTLVL